MSIIAEIIGATLRPSGVVTLHLGPVGDDGPGQSQLVVINPPAKANEFLIAVVGLKIWGSSSEIRVGDTKWADRIGFTQIRLVRKHQKKT